MNWLNNFFNSLIDKAPAFPGELWALFTDMGFYLMIGMFFAGLLHVLISKERITRHLGHGSRFAVIKAAMLGVPLPLCSCGVVPTAVGLSKSGASIGAVSSFLISTPQTGIDSIIATGGMMGPVFAIFRPFAAFISGIVGGSLIQLTSGKKKVVLEDARSDCGSGSCSDESCDSTASANSEQSCCSSVSESDSCCSSTPAKESLLHRIGRLFKFGFIEFLDDIAGHMIVGLLIAAAIATFVDADFVESLGITRGLPAMLIMIAVGLPMYICATSSIPVGLTFLSLGFSPGAVFVFLFAGPVTNAASVSVLGKTLGRKATAVYIATVASLAIIFGLLFDLIVSLFSLDFNSIAAGHHHEAISWFKIAAATIFGLLLVRAVLNRGYQKIRSKLSRQPGISESNPDGSQNGPTEGKAQINTPAGEKPSAPGEVMISIKGMSCQHCVNNATKALRGVHGVDTAEVDLATEQAKISGHGFNPEEAVEAVESVGYKAKLM